MDLTTVAIVFAATITAAGAIIAAWLRSRQPKQSAGEAAEVEQHVFERDMGVALSALLKRRPIELRVYTYVGNFLRGSLRSADEGDLRNLKIRVIRRCVAARD